MIAHYALLLVDLFLFSNGLGYLELFPIDVNQW